MNDNKICLSTIRTPVGDMIAGAMDTGICLLEFHDRRMLATQKERICRLFKAELIQKHHPHFTQLETELTSYFDGSQSGFKVPVVYPGSEFQQRVWSSLLTIPYGETRTYAQQSELIGDKKAIRAMARANGDNRIAIIIPCHRVIGSDGSLVGYGGKLWRKKHLLELEGELMKQETLFG